jgi:hypothetical protein
VPAVTQRDASFVSDTGGRWPDHHGRPFRVLDAHRIVAALRDAVTDPAVRAIDHDAVGVDAVSDNTALLSDGQLWRRLRGLYA